MLRPRLVLGAVLAAAALAVVVERLVVTDREAVRATLRDARDAAVGGEWDALAALVDPSFSAAGRGRDDFVAWVRRTLAASGVRTFALDVDDVRVEGDRAAARVTVRPGPPLGGLAVSGRVDLLRTEEGWRIEGAEPDDARWMR